ncbi:MAG TPA: hypothetical protein VJX67_04825 [Blastocatellia bacterium]|nr:hypothetical protein [Blastocatellia bacterium]
MHATLLFPSTLHAVLSILSSLSAHAFCAPASVFHNPISIFHHPISLLSIFNLPIPWHSIGIADGLFLSLVTAGVVFNYPGVRVTETTAGAIPIKVVGGNTIKLVGTALRGPINTPTLISSMSNAIALFGAETSAGYLLQSIRGVLETVQGIPLYVVRVVGAGAAQATATLTAATNATWTLSIGSATSFTLSFGAQTTSSQTVSGLTAAALQTALAALSSIGAGNVSVTGSGASFTIAFAGSLANTAEAANALTITPTGGTATLTQTIPGGPVNVLQVKSLGPGSNYNYIPNNASWVINIGSSVTAFTLTFNGQTTSSLTVSGLTAAQIQTALGLLSTIGSGNVTVTGSGTYFTVTLGGSLTNFAEPASLLSSTPVGGSITIAQATAGGFPSGVSVTYLNGRLTVYDNGQVAESYPNVTQANSVMSAQQINGGSRRVQVAWQSTLYSPDNTSTPAGLSGGTDGATVIDATYVGTPAVSGPGGTGIYAFENKNATFGVPGFICIPGITTNIVGQALITHAVNFRDLALIDSTFGNSINAAIAERNQYADDQGHAVYVYGWVQVADVATGNLQWVPRSAYRAAHIVNSHFQPGNLANVGAGVGFTYPNVVALETGSLLDDPTQGALNDSGIDCARDFTAQGQGLVSWAARTISTNPLYQFLQVRVIFNVLAQSIENGLKPYVFLDVDGKGKLASRIKSSLNQLLWGFWDQDILFGDTPADAFKVITETQDPALLEQGILKISVYAKPAPIAERIAVTLYRVPIAFNFKTNEIDVGAITLGQPVQ